jgi:hypothetical protein
LVPLSKVKIPTYSAKHPKRAKASADVLSPKSTLMIMSSTLLWFHCTFIDMYNNTTALEILPSYE